MSDIKITAENEKIYREFHDANTITMEVSYFKAIPIFILIALIGVSLMLGATLMANLAIFISKITSIPEIVLLVPLLSVYISIGGELMFRATSLFQTKQLKKFQKKYPDFDMNTNIKELEKALEEYKNNQLKQSMLKNPIINISELVEDQKLERLNIFESMNSQQKIAYLEKEKKFWEEEIKNTTNSNIEPQKHLDYSKK